MKSSADSVLWTLALFLVCVARASDDVSALRGLYEQQAQALQQLQAKVTALEHSLSQVKHTAAFTASYGTGNIHVGDNGDTLKFSQVVTNIGGGYNPHTGVFTAPYPGTYVFMLHVQGQGDSAGRVGIYREGALLCTAAIDDVARSSSAFDQGACQATVHLTAGQHVFARQHAGDVSLYGFAFNSMSGFLVSPDIS